MDLSGLSMSGSAAPQQRGNRSMVLRTNTRPGAAKKGAKGGLVKGRPDVADFKAGFGALVQKRRERGHASAAGRDTDQLGEDTAAILIIVCAALHAMADLPVGSLYM